MTAMSTTRPSGAPLDLTSLLGTSKAAARIRRAAVEMFAAKGYGATGTREIAARLDLSPGAVYPHYKTKESLLFAISLEGHHRALESVTSVDDPDLAPSMRLARSVHSYVHWHASNTALAQVAQHELGALDAEHFAVIAQLRRQTTAVFRTIIRAGEDTGTFNTIDVEAAVLAISSLGVDVSRWFPSHTFADPAVLADRYVELVLRMVGATSPS